MGGNQNQVIVPVAAEQMDGLELEVDNGGGIYFDFDRLPELTQKNIIEHLDLETKKEFRLVSKFTRSLTDNFVKFPFSWDRHLREAPPGEIAACAGSFKDVLSPLWKFWNNNLIGALVEFRYVHPESQETVYWAAKIITVQGYFVQLRYLSPEEEFGMEEDCVDVWVNLFKTNYVHSIGWNIDQVPRLQLVPPPQILESLILYYGVAEDGIGHGADPLQPVPPSWSVPFFARRIFDAQTIPYTLSNKCRGALESESNVIQQRVKVTDMVEVFDPEKNDILHVGVVRKIHGCRVLIEYQGAEKVQGHVWCHYLSGRFRVSGWATTVGYEVVVPPGLHVAYSPLSLSRSDMEIGGVLEFYTNLQVGMTLEIINPYKPCSIVAGKIVRVLKWGSFIVEINKADVSTHGSGFVCRSVKSFDVFFSGFALQNGIPLEAPFEVDNPNEELTPVPKELTAKIPLENPFEVDELLEAFDWWDFHLRPAKIVEVTGRLVRIRYLGFSPEMDQWVDISSRDIYPMGWAALRDFPIQVPLNFEL